MTKKTTDAVKKDTKFSKDNQPSIRKNGEEVVKSNKRRPIMTEALMLALNEEVTVCAETGVKTKRLRQIADQLVIKASTGDIQAIKEVFDRTEGKAMQAIEMSGKDGGPIKTENVDYSGLSDSALAELMALRGKGEK